MAKSSFAQVLDRGRVRYLTLNNPERKNAVPDTGWDELADAFDDFADSARRVLVVQGADGDFCSGADLNVEALEELRSAAVGHRYMQGPGRAATALHRLPKPTIAAVDGVAVGAGMNLAIGCDIVVATVRAQFAELFVHRGLTLDFGGTWLLPRLVGMARARELALTGRMINAAEALAIDNVLVVGLRQSVSTMDIAPEKVMVFLATATAVAGESNAGVAVSAAFAAGVACWSSCCCACLPLGSLFIGCGQDFFLSRFQLLVKNTAPFAAVSCYLFPVLCVDV